MPKRKRLHISDVILANLLKLYGSQFVTIFLIAIISSLPKSTELNKHNRETHIAPSTKPYSLSLTSISIREVYILLLFWIFYLILRSGDVEIQPGPLSICSSVFSDVLKTKLTYY